MRDTHSIVDELRRAQADLAAHMSLPMPVLQDDDVISDFWHRRRSLAQRLVDLNEELERANTVDLPTVG